MSSVEITNDVLAERLENFVVQNKEDHNFIKDQLKTLNETHELRFEKIEGRTKILEDWKLVFMTKVTLYGSIAIFLGALVGNLAFEFIKGKF